MSSEDIKTEVCRRLWRHDCWGAKYLRVDRLVSWLGKRVKKNGKRVKASIEDLIKEGLLLPHKKRATVSLNPRRILEIETLLEEYL